MYVLQSQFNLQVNPEYTGTFVFTNDFSALLPDVPTPGIGAANLVFCTTVCLVTRSRVERVLSLPFPHR